MNKDIHMFEGGALVIVSFAHFTPVTGVRGLQRVSESFQVVFSHLFRYGISSFYPLLCLATSDSPSRRAPELTYSMDGPQLQ